MKKWVPIIYPMSLFGSNDQPTGKTKKVQLELPEEVIATLKAKAEKEGLTLEQYAAKSVEKNVPKAAQSLPATLVVKLTLHERWVLQCLNKLHTGQENPLRFLLLESFKGKPEVWKQIEKDGRALSPAKFNAGRGKKSKALSDYHDAVRTKSSRGRKPKAQ